MLQRAQEIGKKNGNNKLLTDKQIGWIDTTKETNISEINYQSRKTAAMKEQPQKEGKKFDCGVIVIKGKAYAIAPGKKKGNLNSGAFGTVKLIQDLETGKYYAYKISKSTEMNFLEKFFQNEARIAQAVCEDTPPITIFRKDKKGIKQYEILMPLADGNPLGVSDESTLKLDQSICDKKEPFLILQLFIKMAEEIKKLHDKGIAHRDIKPENFMYNAAQDKVTIIDYGFALDRESDPSLKNSISGTYVQYLEKNEISQQLFQAQSQDANDSLSSLPATIKFWQGIDLFSLGYSMVDILKNLKMEKEFEAHFPQVMVKIKNMVDTTEIGAVLDALIEEMKKAENLSNSSKILVNNLNNPFYIKDSAKTKYTTIKKAKEKIQDNNASREDKIISLIDAITATIERFKKQVEQEKESKFYGFNLFKTTKSNSLTTMVQALETLMAGSSNEDQAVKNKIAQLSIKGEGAPPNIKSRLDQLKTKFITSNEFLQKELK